MQNMPPQGVSYYIRVNEEEIHRVLPVDLRPPGSAELY